MKNSKYIPPQPYEVLMEIASELGLHDTLLNIFTSWPPARECLTQTSKYMVDIIPGLDGYGTLLASIIHDANEGWHSGDGSTERERYLRFLKGIVGRLPQLKDYHVHVSYPRGVDVSWDPMNQSLVGFLEQHGMEPEVSKLEREYIPDHKMPDHDFRALFIGRFLELHDVHLIGEDLPLVVGRSNAIMESNA